MILGLKNNRAVILHQGVYKPVASVSEAVFMLTGMTIGAGILGIPYVVAQVGLKIGLAYILILGAVMMCLNLMLGEIAVRTREPMHLPGFAGKYLGPGAKLLTSFMMIFSAFGVLLAYIIGEGEALSALFGGNPVWWGVLFWGIGSYIVWRGLRAAKKAEKVLSFIVICLIAGLSFFLLPKFQVANWQYINIANLFLPYGVILFALHAGPAVVEAHALLPGSERHFRKAIVIGSLIPVAVYALFALAVAGVMGAGATEVATVGLGQMGRGALFVGNLFAILAMGTAFFGQGVALKQLFIWDFKLNRHLSELLVIFFPLFLFMLGLRSFVAVLDVVGGVFIGITAMLTVLVCWRARSAGDLPASRYNLHHFWLLAVPVFAAFALAAILSIMKLAN
ncbi:hypothetical protein EPN28_03790 [Patescibacteria group bacterium]|nr:MAG: hypothetical protein EPN28_03790 [Patescibacteria group bacterium]